MLIKTVFPFQLDINILFMKHGIDPVILFNYFLNYLSDETVQL